jgi:hypothetical protein
LGGHFGVKYVMENEAPRAPMSVYLLAEHLDGALAAGEDLVSRGADWRALAENPGHASDFADQQRAIAEEVRGFEMILIARIMKAREHARILSEVDDRFSSIAKLFISGTSILMDAVAECGDATEADFETGDSLIAYVRGRGLIAPDAAFVMQPASLTIDDSFLVAKRIALGPLLDMSAAFLDALETHYELFLEDPDGVDTPGTIEVRREFGKRDRAPLN